MKKMRKGFTLIELLVVIALLGALAAMASISGSEAMTTAKAGNIISNLKNLSVAVNEYCFDNMNSLYGTTLPGRTEIWYYMNKGVSDDTDVPEAKLSNYYIATEATTGKSLADVDWYVGYKFPSGTEPGVTEAIAVKEKLDKRAAEAGLYGGTYGSGVITLAGKTDENNIYNKDAIVWMKAREKSRRTAPSGS